MIDLIGSVVMRSLTGVILARNAIMIVEIVMSSIILNGSLTEKY